MASKTMYESLIKWVNSPDNSDQLEPFSPAFKDAVVIKADNVAEYLYSQEKPDWLLSHDFPNCAPPFETLFVEFTVPQMDVYKEDIVENPDAGQKRGILFQAHEVDDDFVLPESMQEILRPGAKWLYEIVVFFDDWKNWIQGWMINVDADGKILLDDGQYKYFYNKVFLRSFGSKAKRMMELFDSDDVFVGYLYVALLTICFMHCKNVEWIDHVPSKNKRGRNRHGPFITYKTLEINPMKKILKSEGGSEKTGIKQALHICRGHFKDYRSGGGLFGKYQDIYWWDSHVKGSEEHGEVIKDYEVKPDES